MAKAAMAGRNKRSRAAGATFESMIDGACCWYSADSKAKIEKEQEPMKPIKALPGGKFLACYTEKAGVDYKGTLVGGRAVAFEAKHTDTEVMQRSRLEPWQMDYLRQHQQLGAVTFVLLSFGLQNFYRVPFRVWDDMKKEFGKVSVREADLQEYKINIRCGRLMFLEGLV